MTDFATDTLTSKPKQKLFLRKEIAELLEQQAAARRLTPDLYLDYLIIEEHMKANPSPKTQHLPLNLDDLDSVGQAKASGVNTLLDDL